MADPMSEIFNGTPEAMDEEDHVERLMLSVQVDIDMPDQTLKNNLNLLHKNLNPRNQQASTEAKPKEQKKEQTSVFDEGFDAGDAARTFAEQGLVNTSRST